MPSAPPVRLALSLVLSAGLVALAGVSVARYVTGVGVRSSGTPVVVAFGDSLTEGSGLLARPWPSVLARRLEGRKGGGPVTVVNAGISGNRLLREGFGPSGLTRFEADALRRPGVRWVIVLEGINDLGYPGTVDPGATPVTSAELIDGYRQLIRQARASGVKIYGGTLLPFEGAASGYFTPDKETVRQAVNGWIRSTREFDAVIDFEAAVRDPSRPSRLLPDYDDGDHLHLGAAGQRALGEAVDLHLFD
ncbi:MAG TPA: SGNH/GDSL hydrolase family protein [Myxococcaceae bacterium]|nr:SGNH/GDSL hydrolase family protein [Myxococcaceae bacterium]